MTLLSSQQTKEGYQYPTRLQPLSSQGESDIGLPAPTRDMTCLRLWELWPIFHSHSELRKYPAFGAGATELRLMWVGGCRNIPLSSSLSSEHGHGLLSHSLAGLALDKASC